MGNPLHWGLNRLSMSENIQKFLDPSKEITTVLSAQFYIYFLMNLSFAVEKKIKT
jgi:hypothetical protein